MRKYLLAAAALGMLVTSVEAAPFAGNRAVGADAPTAVENVFWRRVCDARGRHCRMVWFRGHRHHHHRYWR